MRSFAAGVVLGLALAPVGARADYVAVEPPEGTPRNGLTPRPRLIYLNGAGCWPVTPCSSIVTVSTDFPETDFDTVISIRDACAVGAVELACRDDIGWTNLRSTGTWRLGAGEYAIAIDRGSSLDADRTGEAGDLGTYRLAITVIPDYP